MAPFLVKDRVERLVRKSQSQSQRHPRSSLPAAKLTADMETMAQFRGSMDQISLTWDGLARGLR